MEYNSARENLILPEYGRNVQKMVQYAVNVKDKEERNKTAKAIVSVMAQLNPQLREITDYKQKLWDQLFIISDFKLDVDSPYPRPSAQALHSKPEKVHYPNKQIRFRHYGNILELIIKEIIKIEDGPARDAIIEKTANFMKMSYLSWNHDSVSDELIIDDLNTLSGGKLKLHANAKLSQTSEILARTHIGKRSPAGKGKSHGKYGRPDMGKRRDNRRNKGLY